MVEPKSQLDEDACVPSKTSNQPVSSTDAPPQKAQNDIEALPTTVKVAIKISGLRNATRNLALDLGLGHDTVTELGDIWHQLCESWVAAETALEKGGGPKPVELDARQVSVPVPLKQWSLKVRGMQIEHIDLANIGLAMCQWWNKLKKDLQLDINDLVKKDWCVAGPSGVLLLVMGMKMWGLQLEKDARSMEWHGAVLELIQVFQKIPTADSLYVVLTP